MCTKNRIICQNKPKTVDFGGFKHDSKTLKTRNVLQIYSLSTRFVFYFLAYSKRSYTSTHLFEDGTRGAAATRKGAPSTRREYEVAGAL